MPTVADKPPEAVTSELAELDEALDAAVPARHVDRYLLVATWNLRAFGGLTDRWVAGDDNSPATWKGCEPSVKLCPAST